MNSMTTLPKKLIQAAQLESVRLKRLLAESRVRSKEEIGKAQLTIGYSAAPAKNRPESGFWVSVRAEAVVKDVTLTAPESAVRIVADVELRYNLPDGFELTEEDLTIFAETNAVLNAWPYLREAVQNSSVRLGFPPILLPLYRLSPPTPQQPDQPKPTGEENKAPKRAARKK